MVDSTVSFGSDPFLLAEFVRLSDKAAVSKQSRSTDSEGPLITRGLSKEGSSLSARAEQVRRGSRRRQLRGIIYCYG